jgi:hypothetical protein
VDALEAAIDEVDKKWARQISFSSISPR